MFEERLRLDDLDDLDDFYAWKPFSNKNVFFDFSGETPCARKKKRVISCDSAAELCNSIAPLFRDVECALASTSSTCVRGA